MEPLPPLPDPTLPGPDLPWGLHAGAFAGDPVAVGPRAGHPRRWLYAAAASDDVAVGAAVVEALPGWAPIGVAFVWAWVVGEVVTWERRALVGASCRVGRVPADGAVARIRTRGEHVVLGADGSIDLRIRLADGRWLSATVGADAATPAVLATPTPAGGWNATQKLAGVRATGEVALGAHLGELDGGAWTDWTAGRQDRHTAWRWAAAVGTTADGRHVGLNASTGMNGAGPGEDVVWWDGVPYPLELETLAPVDDPATGPWRVAGPGWDLDVSPVGVRQADEDLLLVRSRYVQPIGRFAGTLPGPGGRAVAVSLVGVTEDHEAVW